MHYLKAFMKHIHVGNNYQNPVTSFEEANFLLLNSLVDDSHGIIFSHEMYLLVTLSESKSLC